MATLHELTGTTNQGLYWALPENIRNRYRQFDRPEFEPHRQAVEQFWNQYYKLYGKAPTENDFTKYLPNYLADINLGDQSLLSGYEQEQKSPEALKKKAPEQYGTVGEQIKSMLGREATQAELDHFGSLLASGDLDAYTFQQFVQSTPEYTQKRDETFRSGLRSEMADSDKRYLTESVLPAIQSQYALAGRSFDSSAFQSAMANAAQSQNVDREKYLSNLAASMYGGRQEQAYGDYATNRDRMYGIQDYYRQRSDANADWFRDRKAQLQDFDIQRSAYEDYLRKYGKRNSWVNDLASGLDMANSAANIFKGWGK